MDFNAVHSPVPVFRVTEHERLRLGDVCNGHTFRAHHLESLAVFGEHTGQRYFTLGHTSVRFRNFVGVLATPELTVEILPKVDRIPPSGATGAWQNVLLDLLYHCGYVRTANAGTAFLSLRSGSLLDWYLDNFITELQTLLRYGLLHHYQAREAQLGVLKGRLNLSRQLRENGFHRERFQVTYDQFTDRHPANLMIGAALQKLQFLPLNPERRGQLKYLAQLFPKPNAAEKLQLLSPEQIQSDRRLDRYQTALTITRHILQDERPDVRAGRYRGLALLFDMNLLFEEYLYRQLLHWKPAGVQIERQQSAAFWGSNRLRPDLVIATPEDRWVLDTKWRVLTHPQPSAEELRQIYVYCDYFGASKGVLVFPATEAWEESFRRQFSPLPDMGGQGRSCHLYFAKVLTEEGRLNRELGRGLLAVLGISPQML